MDMNPSKLWETVKHREASRVAVRGSQTDGHDLAAEQQQQQRPRVTTRISIARTFTCLQANRLEIIFHGLFHDPFQDCM